MSWDRVERLIGTDNLERLSHKRVGIVGLGSGGGFIAQSLAMSGVGQFVLVDDDTLEEANIVRHVADRRYLGQSKAEVVADLIRQRNPEAKIDVRIGRIEENVDVLDNLDILAVGVDGEGSKYVLNEACLERGLTAVYAGVYERGEGGDVAIIRPYDGPCYACWAAELREGLAFGEADTELDYGMIGPEGTLEAEPGLWLHVVRVAAVQSDLILNELLRGSDVHEIMPGNTIILANRSLEIIQGQVNEPHTAVWVQVERDPDCLVCGKRAGLAVGESETALSLTDLADSMGIELEEEDDAAQQ
jgi:molybdopterin/thiamine biosynthesis adenylyltransferase